MAFLLTSLISIGDYSFRGVHELAIKKSVKSFIDTATLKVPGKCRVVSGNAAEGNSNRYTAEIATSPETAEKFKEGDPVIIELGYNGDLRNEFKGFVRRVNLTTPISIDMEGYAWQLRNQNILASWRVTTVKEVLQRVIQGTDIVLSPDIPQIALTNFYIKNQSGIKVLDYLKEKMLLTVYFDGNVLYAGIQEARNTADAGINGILNEVVYNIGFNVPSDQPDLKKRLGKDNLVRVRLKTRGKDGKQILYEAGDEGGQVY
jgi:hypothetical protein